jgi:serine/threonine-protein phosphatase 2A regulatory subunit B'
MPPKRTVTRKTVDGKVPDTGGPPGKGAKGASPSNVPNQFLKQRPVSTTPQSDILPELGLRRSLPSVYSTEDYGQIQELPPLTSVGEDRFNELMQQKLQQCRIICNFIDPMADLKSKTTKQGYLQEILDHISQPKFFKLFEPETFKLFFAMIKSNLIRALPPVPALAMVPMVGDDVNDSLTEPSWVHLELVYEIFKRFLESTLLEPTQFAMYVDQSFISRFLKLFNTTDQRERDHLKMVLHRLYLRFVHQRLMIKQAIQNIFLTYIYETRYFCGISELLEIMNSIVNGYLVPLKQENIDFLVKVLIPLHTSNFLHLFHANLFYCVMQYIQKDPNLIPVVIHELFKMWPVSCSLKQLFFMGLVSRTLEIISEDQFVQLKQELFHKIGRSIVSNNFQVSEQGMLLWKGDRFLQLTTAHAKEIFPIICPYLYRTGTNHWHTAIKNLAVSVIRICMDTSPPVFEAFSRTMKAQDQQEVEKVLAKKATWKMVLATAVARDPGVNVNDQARVLETVFSKDGK